MRRSLVAPSLFTLLVGGWIVGTGPTISWSLLVAGVVFLSTFLSAVAEFTSKPSERAWPAHASVVIRSVARPLVRACLAIALLPYDALISARVYKPAMTHAQAREIILKGRGQHFDPDVVEAFLAVEAQFQAIAARFQDRAG